MREFARLYPVVTVTGPRQSGKTTLCRAAFPDKPHVSLEPLDTRAFANSDPRGFLDRYRDGAILDEVQNAAGLLSYLQAEVDERPKPGRFVLTGSQHFGLLASVSQSLAGRTGILHLLPLSLDELRRFPGPPATLLDTLVGGGYPAIYDRGIPHTRWLSDYVTTYIERDVRQLLGIGDLTTFATFLRLCAGRSGQEINYSALGGDVGVSHNTARAWLSVLETSFLCFRIPVFHRNSNKRLVKAAKLHFFDSGLLCHLLGIREAEQLAIHPLRGAVFESWVASEVYKARVHKGLEPSLFHLRQTRGPEIDLVVDGGSSVRLVEAKSAATVVESWLSSLLAVGGELATRHKRVDLRLIYGGTEKKKQRGVDILPWDAIPSVGWGD